MNERVSPIDEGMGMALALGEWNRSGGADNGELLEAAAAAREAEHGDI
jgi:hypothetical protein